MHVKRWGAPHAFLNRPEPAPCIRLDCPPPVQPSALSRFVSPVLASTGQDSITVAVIGGKKKKRKERVTQKEKYTITLAPFEMCQSWA